MAVGKKSEAEKDGDESGSFDHCSYLLKDSQTLNTLRTRSSEPVLASQHLVNNSDLFDETKTESSSLQKDNSFGPKVQFASSTVVDRDFGNYAPIQNGWGDDGSDSSDEEFDPSNRNKRNATHVRHSSGGSRNGRRRSRTPRRRTMSETSSFSGVSSMSSSSSSDDSYSVTAPDGGWGWVIVMASFFVNMIADGVTFSFGVLFVELQNEFGESKAVTAGVVSLFHAVPLLSGPIASALTDRYGCRKVTIFGATLASIGFLLSSMATSIEVLYLTFGIISGFGLSLCYVAAIVIVAYYFDKRRSFATGISVCGSGVGTFAFAPLTQYLISEYGSWRGATIILAGFFLNMCVCGALYRDLEWTIKKKKKKQPKVKRFGGSMGTMSVQSHQSNMPAVEEIRALLESGDITALFSQEELDHCPRLSSSLVNLPTYISKHERLPDEVVNALSQNKKAYQMIVENYPDLVSLNETQDTLNRSDVNSELSEPSTVRLKRKVSSLFKKKPNKSILKRPPTTEETVISIDETAAAPTSSVSIDHSTSIRTRRSMYLHHLKMRRQSLTYRGAMLNISKYRLRASSCPDIYRNSMTTIAQEEVEGPSCSWSAVRAYVANCFCNCDYVTPTFIIFCLSNFILYAWYDVMYVYLVDYAERDLHFSSRDSTFLISIIGILNTVGEVIIGWLGDQSWMNIDFLYAVCMLACGLATVVVPFLTSYSWLGVMAGLYGLAISANYSLTSPILVELVSLEQFSNAYGLLLLVQGISNLVGPPFAGYLYDITSKWIYTFGFAGGFIVLSGLLLLVLPCFKKAKQMRRKCSSSSSDTERQRVDTEVAVDIRSMPMDIPTPNGNAVHI